MEVAVEQTRHLRSIRHHGEHLGEVEPVKAYAKVLLALGAVVRIYLHAHAVVGTQAHVGGDALVLGKEHVVLLVYLKLLVAQHGVDAAQRQLYAARLHVCLKAEGYAETLSAVEHTCAEVDRRLGYGSTHLRVKHKLWVGAVVAHQSLEACLGRIGLESHTYGVYLHTRSHQRVEVKTAVDALAARYGKVGKGALEGIAKTLEHTAKDIVLAHIGI